MNQQNPPNSGLGVNPVETGEFLDEEVSGELSIDDLAEITGGALEAKHSIPNADVRPDAGSKGNFFGW